jgi:anti-sigma regulatory factor (Ser/Thr protein kinase)
MKGLGPRPGSWPDLPLEKATALPDPRRHAVQHPVDSFEARRSAMELAQQIGFDRRACVEIAIATSELAVNIAKYGRRGHVTLSAVDDPRRGPGIAIVASDQGPPSRDFQMALRDGCDDEGPLLPEELSGRHGLGAGLGAVARFTDELGWQPTPEGKEVRAVRFRDRAGRDRPSRPGS